MKKTPLPELVERIGQSAVAKGLGEAGDHAGIVSHVDGAEHAADFRRDSLAAVERRIRRLVVRRGWHMLKAEKPDKRVLAHGGYMLRDEDFKIVFGNAKYDFSATLEECEAFLLEQNKLNGIGKMPDEDDDLDDE